MNFLVNPVNLKGAWEMETSTFSGKCGKTSPCTSKGAWELALGETDAEPSGFLSGHIAGYQSFDVT